MDRFDVWLNISKIDYEKLGAKTATGSPSAQIRERIIKARAIQAHRFKSRGIHKTFNAEMGAQNIEKCVVIDETARKMLTLSAEKFELSGRAFHRVIKVAQTIADLAGDSLIKNEHLLEALQYRQKIV
jgi:magnesium chelatase family protein